MNVINKQRLKKKHTRRSLDKLRKRTLENKNNDNSAKFQYKPKCNNQITNERLTLALFKKSIASKTVSRDSIGGSKTTNSGDTIKKIKICDDNINNETDSLENHIFTKINVNGEKVHKGKPPDSVPIFSSLHHEKINDDIQSEEKSYDFEHRELLSLNDSSSSLDTESGGCMYEMFMKEMPIYLQQHFPALTRDGILDCNIAYLKQAILENSYKKKQTLKSTYKMASLDDSNSVMQDPMDYCQTDCFGLPNVKEQPNVSVSGSSPCSQFTCNSIFISSPEYQYFPHKLNQ